MGDLAYYNEIDPFAAEWLRNLIAAGVIAPGHVDSRSITEVTANDLRGYTQCHFFAGVGVWSHALRLAGVPDSRKIWTASCPCQPFSTAGKGIGFDDERHLWPHFHWLVQQCRPPVVLGEQVASKDAEPWIDLVHADMEAMGYAFGCVPFPSASIGAPHIRDRNYWVAHANQERREGVCGGRQAGAPERLEIGRLGNPGGESSQRNAGAVHRAQAESDSERLKDGGQRDRHSDAGSPRGLANTEHNGHSRPEADQAKPGGNESGVGVPNGGCFEPKRQSATGPTNGFWRAADWLHCRDGKWRPVEPGTFPLVNGPTRDMGHVQSALARLFGRNRAGRLKGYGNAINAEAAKIFIQSALEVIDYET